MRIDLPVVAELAAGNGAVAAKIDRIDALALRRTAAATGAGQCRRIIGGKCDGRIAPGEAAVDADVKAGPGEIRHCGGDELRRRDRHFLGCRVGGAKRKQCRDTRDTLFR